MHRAQSVYHGFMQLHVELSVCCLPSLIVTLSGNSLAARVCMRILCLVAMAGSTDFLLAEKGAQVGPTTTVLFDPTLNPTPVRQLM